jgi:hypothetical protein
VAYDTSKLADANYITIFTKDHEIQVFDGELSKVNIKGEAVMKGWRCLNTKQWRVPIKPTWSNPNTDTTLLSEKATEMIMAKYASNPHEFVNSVYWRGIMQRRGTPQKLRGSRQLKQVSIQPGHC